MRIVNSPVHDEAISGLKMLDVVIGLTIGDGERTLAQYESLLETAGLKLVGVTPTKSPVNVIEARQR